MAPIREIDVGEARTRYARGWHCLGLTKTFKDGKPPHSVHAFGTKLVVWADTNGDIKILDAYCRHMGGDLSQGEVKGDDIACPFHDWRWSGTGKCADIPYARRVPPLARTRAWISTEKHGQLFVWNDPPEGNPPPPEVTLPDIEHYGTDEWTDWTWNQILIEGSNCREIIDNVVDMAHFFYIHYAFPTFFKNVFEGHVAEQFLNTRGRPDKGDVHAVRAGVDPRVVRGVLRAVLHDQPMTNSYGGYKVESVLINCHYPPITQDSFMLQYGIIVKKPTGMTDEQSDKMAAKFTEASVRASCRTSRSGRTRPRSRIRSCARRTGRSTSCAAGTSSSTSTSPTSPTR